MEYSRKWNDWYGNDIEIVEATVNAAKKGTIFIKTGLLCSANIDILKLYDYQKLYLFKRI